MSHLRTLVLLSLATAVARGDGQTAAQTPRYDLAIIGGTVVDGSGAPGRRADVAIKDGRIALVGRVPPEAARASVDATGLIVAPGFIDVHTHADELVETPRAENFVRMGVTSIVAGNCGGSSLDVGEAFAKIRESGVSVNFATLIGHNTVRRAAIAVIATSADPELRNRLREIEREDSDPEIVQQVQRMLR